MNKEWIGHNQYRGVGDGTEEKNRGETPDILTKRERQPLREASGSYVTIIVKAVFINLSYSSFLF